MSTNRCSQCATNWPTQPDYQPCPECGGKTDTIGNANAIDAAEATSRKRHADFERYYADRAAQALATELEQSKAIA